MADRANFPSDPIRSLTPAVGPAIAFILGIAVHNHCPLSPAWLIPGTAALAALAVALSRFNWPNRILTLTAVAMLGVAVADTSHFRYRSDDIGLFADDQPALVRVRIRITDEPRMVAADPTDPHPLPPRMSADGDAVAILTDHGWADVSGELPISLTQPDPSLAAGQTVEVLGMLERPRAAANPGEFDWAAYYRARRVLTTLTVSRAANVRHLEDGHTPPLVWLSLKARHLLATGFTTDHALDEAVLQSLVLGDRGRTVRPVRDKMQSIGVGYQLNFTGLHLTVVALVVGGICRVCRTRPQVTLMVSVAVVIVYGVVSTPGHSGVRAILLTIGFAYAVLSKRSAQRLQRLSLAAVAMLVAAPLELFEAGFQLSFVVVAAFAVAVPAYRRPGALDPIRENTVTRRAMKHVRRALLYATVAWLASTPLAAYWFGTVSPWAETLGLLLLPLVVTALLLGVLKIVATLLWPAAAGVWATVAGWPVQGLRWAVDLLAKLPGGSVQVAAPPAWVVAGCYGLLALPLVPRIWWDRLSSQIRRVLPLAASRWLDRSDGKPQSPTRGERIRFAARWSGPILAVTIVVAPHPSAVDKPRGDLRLTLLSLGAGQCAVAELPGGDAVIFDIGSTNAPNVTERIVEPFLQDHRVTRVDDLLLSHGDYDHISGAVDLLARFDVDSVLTTHHFRRHAVGNDPDLRLLDVLDNRTRSTRLVSTGDAVDVAGVHLAVLWPPPGGDFDSNDAGMVVRLTYAGVSVLLPADIQDPAFAGLLRHPEQLKADVLVAPHHGSSESMTAAFLAAVNAKQIISSNEPRLTQKQKRFDRLAAGIPLLRTSAVGSITVTIHDNGTWDVTTFRKR